MNTSSLSLFGEYVTERITLERLTLKCPTVDTEKVIESLQREKWLVTSKHYTDSSNSFVEMTAERNLEQLPYPVEDH